MLTFLLTLFTSRLSRIVSSIRLFTCVFITTCHSLVADAWGTKLNFKIPSHHSVMMVPLERKQLGAHAGRRTALHAQRYVLLQDCFLVSHDERLAVELWRPVLAAASLMQQLLRNNLKSQHCTASLTWGSKPEADALVFRRAGEPQVGWTATAENRETIHEVDSRAWEWYVSVFFTRTYMSNSGMWAWPEGKR